MNKAFLLIVIAGVSLLTVTCLDQSRSSPDTPTPISQSDCHPAYPDVCIAPPPPDLDCGEIQFRRFTVLQPDPHGFDRDRDGVGCES